MLEEQRRSTEKKIYVYLLTICVCCILYYCIQGIFDGKYFVSVFLNNPKDVFMDHFNSLNNAKYDPYQDQLSNYPAMACLIYKAFLAMIPNGLRQGTGFSLKNVQAAMIPFIIYNCITIWFIQVIVSGRSLLEKKSKTVFSLILILCAPVMFTIERGNLILLSFALTMFFSFFFESENKVLKELSFIALAFAAAIKIYPAIFGLLLVKRKRIKETMRLVLYGVIAFIMPFFYYDGFESLQIMIRALGYTTNMSDEIGYGVNLSLYNIIKTIGTIFHVSMSDIMIYAIYTVVIGTLIVSFFVLKKKWQEMLCISLILIFFPKTNYYYVMIFMLIPFIECLNHCQIKKEKWDFVEYIALVIFAIILVPWASNLIPVFTDYKFPVSYTMLLYYLALCWLALLVMLELVEMIFKRQHGCYAKMLFMGTGVFSVITVVMAVIG